MNEEERYAAVKACRWVDEVVEAAPYVTEVDMLRANNCDFCVHGDDITTTAGGADCYQAVKDSGMYKECKRTQGVSTSELVGRMLAMTADEPNSSASSTSTSSSLSAAAVLRGGVSSDLTKSQAFLDELLQEFISHHRPITPQDTVVYVDGGFDLFHVGHAEFLREAKQLGTYLVVGIHSDESVQFIKGSTDFPLMNVNERALEVLSCKYVDDVVIGAPYLLDMDFLEARFDHIDLIVHGSIGNINAAGRYTEAKELGIYREIESPMPGLTTDTMIDRIVRQRLHYEERNKKKAAKALLAEADSNAADRDENPAASKNASQG